MHVDQKPVALVQKRVALHRVALVQHRVALVQETLGRPFLQHLLHPTLSQPLWAILRFRASAAGTRDRKARSARDRRAKGWFSGFMEFESLRWSLRGSLRGDPGPLRGPLVLENRSELRVLLPPIVLPLKHYHLVMGTREATS